jgi:hypothetical protein
MRSCAFGRHPRDRHLRDPRRDRRRDRPRRPGRPRRAQRGRQDHPAAIAAGRDEPDRGEVQRKRGLTSACSPRRRISTRRSWPRRTCDRRPPPAPPTSIGWPRSSRALERAGIGSPSRLRGAPAPVRDPGRLHARPAGRRGAVRSGVRPRRMDQAADGAVRRRADARGARPAGHRRPGPAAARRADQPPGPRRARMAGGAPAPPRGSLLVASHDRAFLDATVTRVWELRDRA